MTHILITGGCGYVGTLLTQQLLEDGYAVTVVDIQWFGNYLTPHPCLTVHQQDIRDTAAVPLDGVTAVIHLANIANDPGVDLNPVLSWEVNVLAARQLAEQAVRAGVKQFVYASSGSVYGVKTEPQVTEDLPLLPISVYNKTKMVTERVLLSYQDQMQVHCIRPATVCGWSPRMRLDLSVNMLTMQALKNGRITVFGGKQTRPNIHIRDMVDVYRHFLNHSELPSGCYNAGFENISILDIAERVREKVPAEIAVSESNDPRSYRQNSDKLRKSGFAPAFTVSDAIDEMVTMYHNGQLVDVHDNRLALAAAMGATHLINSRQMDAPAAILNIAGTTGVDVFIDNTGQPDIIELGYRLSKPQGRVILVGVPRKGNDIQIYSLPLHFGKIISGSHGGECLPHADIPRYHRLYQQGRIRLRELITDRFGLDDINVAINAMRDGTAAGRCLIDMQAPTQSE